ncbi:DUF1549 domain-containing protein [Singulisphaera sp. PoT]|uniref:DUF1549 domain-containing protein n=1 Tax=Singulisphaera sp. PoT TaxID=3411797 RepID=UPI003BF46778
MRRSHPSLAWVAANWVLIIGTANVGLAEGEKPLPLHERIDREIESKLDGQIVAPPATDAEFLRRAWLDLAGTIPTVSEAKEFLDDPSAYKRTALIDRLLASPSYARRMATVFDVMLMERRADLHVPAAEWREFLRKAFARNQPYDQLVREILKADGTEPGNRGPAKFYLDREGQPNLLTRDVGRLFLGRDFQCAQCHDHPLISDFKQGHYYGLFAFFNRSYLVADDRGAMTFGEKADGDVSFSSVFKKKIVRTTKPRIIEGTEAAEPAVPKGQEYRLSPGEKIRALPLHSRRDLLPDFITSPDVPEFSRTIANRLWAMMIGRGIVHPLDMDHGDNPPSHPELLEMLTKEFANGKYDVKAFIREIALTRVYQRSSEPPPGGSTAEATPESLSIGLLKPMNSEQIAWSLMQAAGIVANQRKQAEHQLIDVDTKFRDITAQDDKRKQIRTDSVEKAVYDQLQGSVQPFTSRFGSAAGQAENPGQSSVDQALFFANSNIILEWFSPSPGNLGGRLIEKKDPGELAEELYLAILSRRPSAEERDEVARYLADRGNSRGEAIRELAWALTASTEFRFNH